MPASDLPPIPLSDGELDLEHGVVRRAARVSRLTEHEVDVLRYLWKRRGQDVPRAEILTELLGYPPNSGTRAVDLTIHRLRRKLEVDPAAPCHLVTVYGEGYRLVPAPERGPLRTNVPPHRDALFGREALLGTLLDTLRTECEPIGLIGPAGVGKSRLAAELARRAAAGACPAGAFRVDLSRSAAAEPALAQAAGLEVRDPQAATVARALRRRGPCLVVLDEADSDPDGATRLLEALARAGVACVTTSRAPLSGTRSVPVSPLGPADARALFEARAEEAMTGWRPSADDDEAIARITEGTDGLPLALELAANRVRAMSPIAIAQALDRSLKLLRARGTGRHASMEGALVWSWQSLDDTSRIALSEMSVFRGGASRAAAEHVISGPDPAKHIDTLVDRALVQADRDRVAPFHVVREFALAHGDPEAIAAARARHAAWFARRVEVLSDRLRTRDYLDAFDELVREQSNLRAALGAATGEARAWLVFGLAYPHERFPDVDILALLEEQVALLSEPSVVLARVLGMLSWLYTRVDQWDRAAEVGRQMLDVACVMGDRRGRVDAHRTLGACRSVRGDLDGSLAELERAVEIAGDDRALQTRALSVLGAVKMLRRELDAARSDLERSAAIAEADGDLAVAEAPLVNLGSVLSLQGDHAGALAAWERALAYRRSANDFAVSNILHNRGWAHLIRGDWETALDDLELSSDGSFEAGRYDTFGVAGTAAAVVLARLGLRAVAVDKAEHVVRTLREVGSDRSVVPASVYAALLSLTGRPEAARTELAGLEDALSDELGIDRALTDRLIRVWNRGEDPGDLADVLESGAGAAREGCTLHVLLLREKQADTP